MSLIFGLFIYIYSNMQKNPVKTKQASKEELDFLLHNMPRGMISMIVLRTKEPRWKVVYELNKKTSLRQNTKIIQAAREILFAVTGMSFEKEKSKRTNK